MGSKWIRISDRLPDIGDRIWVLVNIPEYYDGEDEKTIPGRREVFEGYRYLTSADGSTYGYFLMNEDMDSFDITDGETQAFDWGEVDTVVAWMPVEVPEAEVIA